MGSRRSRRSAASSRRPRPAARPTRSGSRPRAWPTIWTASTSPRNNDFRKPATPSEEHRAHGARPTERTEKSRRRFIEFPLMRTSNLGLLVLIRRNSMKPAAPRPGTGPPSPCGDPKERRHSEELAGGAAVADDAPDALESGADLAHRGEA